MFDHCPQSCTNFLLKKDERVLKHQTRSGRTLKSQRREADKKRSLPIMNIQITKARAGIQGNGTPPSHDIQEFTKPHITLTDRLRSGYHRIWYEASQALRWSRGTYQETPIGTHPHLSPAQRDRIEELVTIYGTRFELRYPPETSLLNYGYLDLLDRGRHALKWIIPREQHVCDVGSANFAYAAALQTFFHPSLLVGTEVDGHRLYCNGRSRIDYAQGHIQDLPHTRYVVTDYRHYHQHADIITAWYPFVTPKPLLAWRLPLSLFDPAALFATIANNLIIGGTLVMINHSPTEAKVAHSIAESVGLVSQGHYVHSIPLRPRTQPAVLTLWHHS